MKSTLQVTRLRDEDTAEFKREMQKAFQYGYEQEYGPCNDMVLPEEDIDRSLKADGTFAYSAMLDGEMAGGAIVKINRKTGYNHLELLFVKTGIQSRGVGLALWNKIESMYPDTNVWETCTPYFEKRNIHFYVNRCGFQIVEFFNPRHPFPPPENEYHGGMNEDASRHFFRFVKRMNSPRRESPAGDSETGKS